MIVDAIACCAPLGAPRLSEDEAEATAELFRALGVELRAEGFPARLEP